MYILDFWNNFQQLQIKLADTHLSNVLKKKFWYCLIFEKKK